VSVRLAAQEWMLEGSTLEEKFDFALSVGFDGIELAARGGEFETRLDELLEARAAGVVMPSAVTMPTAFLGDFDPGRRLIAIEELTGWLRMLDRAGVSGIVCPNSFGVFSLRLPPFAPPRAAVESRQLLVSALREALGRSAGSSTVIYLEPLNRFEDYLITTLAEASSVVDEIDDARVRVCADTFHMSIEEVAVGDALRRTGGRLAHVQLGDTNRLEPGAGHYDWAETMAALAEVGYEGWLAMECELSGAARDILPRVSAMLKA
jgi:sugar phosphate isomerase/epimerase